MDLAADDLAGWAGVEPADVSQPPRWDPPSWKSDPGPQARGLPVSRLSIPGASGCLSGGGNMY